MGYRCTMDRRQFIKTLLASGAVVALSVPTQVRAESKEHLDSGVTLSAKGEDG